MKGLIVIPVLALFLEPAQNLKKTCDIHLEVTSIRNTTGTIHAALYQQQAVTLPEQKNVQLVRLHKSDADIPSVHINFQRLPCGIYALAVFHDENENGTLDLNADGHLLEGAGNSNNTKINKNIITFSDAEFILTPDKKNQTIHLQYNFIDKI